MDYKTYKLKYAPQVIAELKSIKAYILELSQSENIANKRIDDLFKSMETLKVFPEAGFNADEKYGRRISKDVTTRGMTLKKDYLVLYDIDEANSCVNVRYLFSTKSDYMKLFK
ncbi:TPA: type II toxin-antitoxin system mRNA interferase toxin, RelE/StbE family [Streptococcus suis]|nr:type II toxin-antitoxin system mRNA interferase toxin, RelE/StbE family [Streptococcus suis]HEM2735587.1 type II toxin-antitoxin system mRNA interferase toxin, RelE/StbE family [Streptococcus suis]